MDLYLTFALATFVLMVTPGPNMALTVANSLAHGPRRALLTVAGAASALAVHLSVVTIGLGWMTSLLADWFEWLRWIGVAYLLYLGVSYWRSAPVDLTRTAPERRSPRAMVLRALLVSLSNPKTLLFYGALFPQFLSGGLMIGAGIGLALARKS